MSLSVGHLRTRLRAAAPITSAQRGAWLDAFAAQDGDALAAGLVGADEWLLIRRLTLATRWQADAADAEVGQLWGQALRRAIEAAKAGTERGGESDDGASRGASDVLFYASRRAAAADLVYRSALGQTGRQWAWQRMGLLPREGLSATVALAEGVALLLREPALTWPVLQRLVAGETATAALTASLRALPASAWAPLLAACPQTAGHWQMLNAAEPLPQEGDDELAFDTLAVRQLLAWAAARAWFAQAHREVVTVLLAAQARPGARGASAARSLATGRALLQACWPQAVPPRRAGQRPVIGAEKPPRQDLTPTAEPEAHDAPEAPALPEPTLWRPTGWAGALFWLSRASALESDDLPLLLRELARSLGVPDDEAALPAFCGGLVPQAEAPAALVEQARACVQQWRDWLDAAAPELPEPRLAAVCQRAGRLRLEPGWIELHLPLHAIDTAVRRLGLDLDPGWLPGLGCVVRFVYDDE